MFIVINAEYVSRIRMCTVRRVLTAAYPTTFVANFNQIPRATTAIYPAIKGPAAPILNSHLKNGNEFSTILRYLSRYLPIIKYFFLCL